MLLALTAVRTCEIKLMSLPHSHAPPPTPYTSITDIKSAEERPLPAPLPVPRASPRTHPRHSVFVLNLWIANTCLKPAIGNRNRDSAQVYKPGERGRRWSRYR